MQAWALGNRSGSGGLDCQFIWLRDWCDGADSSGRSSAWLAYLWGVLWGKSAQQKGRCFVIAVDRLSRRWPVCGRSGTPRNQQARAAGQSAGEARRSTGTWPAQAFRSWRSMAAGGWPFA